MEENKIKKTVVRKQIDKNVVRLKKIREDIEREEIKERMDK